MKTTKLRPYVVEESGRALVGLSAELNDQLYQNYGSDYRFGGRGKIVVGSLFDYEALLADLAEIPHAEFVTHREMAAAPCPPDKLQIGIRHDVDADIIAAERQAEIERDHGVRASWYVLHTAPYYGTFRDGVFIRNGCMASIYRRLQALGHEVALHTDALGVCQQHGVDGAEALVTEIEWLRGLGLEIRGTVAHNSKPVYGAWNYEIFEGRFDPKEDPALAPEDVEHEGRWAPLRVLDEKALGLEYEGNDVLWQTHTPVEYGATRAVNRWRWVAHTKRVGEQPGAPELPFVDQARLVEDIRALPPGRFVVLVVHPCYYGVRRRRHEGPIRRCQRVTTAVNEPLGWVTYVPQEAQCSTDIWRARQTFQVINHANEIGMLDRPWPAEWQNGAVRILVLGADNVDGATVPVPEHLASRLEELLASRAERSAHVVKLAHPGMGVSRLWSWYERTVDELAPDHVVIGIGDHAVRQNVPTFWSRASGMSRQYPPGDHVAWDEERGEIAVVRASAEWRLHRTTPRSPLDKERRMHRTCVSACYCFMCDRVRERGARPWLLVEARDRTPVATSELIDEVAEACGATVIDPYPRFNDQRLPYRHVGDHRWNATGHRLASEALYEALRDA